MSRGLRVVTMAAVLVAALTVGVAPVLAAAPSNDLYGNATLITSLPYDQTLDTTQATTDATDAEANANCGAPVTLASVWYDFQPASDGGFVVDVSASSYSAGVIVVSGSPGSFVLEACGPGAVAFFGTGFFSGSGIIGSELFPTSIRARALGITYNGARMLGAIAPFVIGWVGQHKGLGSAFYLCGAAFFLAALAATRLPETRGLELE